MVYCFYNLIALYLSASMRNIINSVVIYININIVVSHSFSGSLNDRNSTITIEILRLH